MHNNNGITSFEYVNDFIAIEGLREDWFYQLCLPSLNKDITYLLTMCYFNNKRHG